MAFVPTVIVDTNFLLEIISCHDLMGTLDKAEAAGTPMFGADFEHRRERGRAAVLLALIFHEEKVATYSLHTEALAISGGLVGEADAPYAAVFTTLVCLRVLNGWQGMYPTSPDHVRGNDADDRLVDKAREYGCPLITNEGNTETGIVEKKLRKKARDAGLSVYSPAEYLKAHYARVDEKPVIERFFARLAAESPGFLQSRPPVVARTLNQLTMYLRWLLLEETPPK